jgi:hypothetical protein
MGGRAGESNWVQALLQAGPYQFIILMTIDRHIASITVAKA